MAKRFWLIAGILIVLAGVVYAYVANQRPSADSVSQQATIQLSALTVDNQSVDLTAGNAIPVSAEAQLELKGIATNFPLNSDGQPSRNIHLLIEPTGFDGTVTESDRDVRFVNGQATASELGQWDHSLVLPATLQSGTYTLYGALYDGEPTVIELPFGNQQEIASPGELVKLAVLQVGDDGTVVDDPDVPDTPEEESTDPDGTNNELTIADEPPEPADTTTDDPTDQVTETTDDDPIPPDDPEPSTQIESGGTTESLDQPDLPDEPDTPRTAIPACDDRLQLAVIDGYGTNNGIVNLDQVFWFGFRAFVTEETIIESIDVPEGADLQHLGYKLGDPVSPPSGTFTVGGIHTAGSVDVSVTYRCDSGTATKTLTVPTTMSQETISLDTVGQLGANQADILSIEATTTPRGLPLTFSATGAEFSEDGETWTAGELEINKEPFSLSRIGQVHVRSDGSLVNGDLDGLTITATTRNGVSTSTLVPIGSAPLEPPPAPEEQFPSAIDFVAEIANQNKPLTVTYEWEEASTYCVGIAPCDGLHWSFFMGGDRVNISSSWGANAQTTVTYQQPGLYRTRINYKNRVTHTTSYFVDGQGNLTEVPPFDSTDEDDQCRDRPDIGPNIAECLTPVIDVPDVVVFAVDPVAKEKEPVVATEQVTPTSEPQISVPRIEDPTVSDVTLAASNTQHVPSTPVAPPPSTVGDQPAPQQSHIRTIEWRKESPPRVTRIKAGDVDVIQDQPADPNKKATIKHGDAVTVGGVGEIPNTSLSLLVQSDPLETTVSVDSTGAWTYTLPNNLEPGEHTLSIKRDGEIEYVKALTFALETDEPTQATQDISADTITGVILLPGEQATLIVDDATDETIEVFFDDVSLGRVASTTDQVQVAFSAPESTTPGQHVVTARSDNWAEDLTFPINVEAAEFETVENDDTTNDTAVAGSLSRMLLLWIVGIGGVTLIVWLIVRHGKQNPNLDEQLPPEV